MPQPTTLIEGVGGGLVQIDIFFIFFQPIQYIMAMIVWKWAQNASHANSCESSSKAPGGFKLNICMVKHHTKHIYKHHQPDPILTSPDPDEKSHDWKRAFSRQKMACFPSKCYKISLNSDLNHTYDALDLYLTPPDPGDKF